MPSEFKHTPEQARALWVAALRSGEYQQGREYLKKLDCGVPHLCCLGVACELFCEHETNIERKAMKLTCFGSCTQVLPTVVMKWLAIRDNMGAFESTSLIDLNDGLGKNFAEIADIIESAPPGLFVEVVA